MERVFKPERTRARTESASRHSVAVCDSESEPVVGYKLHTRHPNNSVVFALVVLGSWFLVQNAIPLRIGIVQYHCQSGFIHPLFFEVNTPLKYFEEK